MNKRTLLINKITKIGIFSALSVVLYYIRFPLPIFPSFLEVNFSMLPIILIAFMFGPLEGGIVLLLRFLFKIPFSHTLLIGELGDLIIGALVVIPTSILYGAKKTKKSGIVALSLAFVIWTIFGTLSNLITIPLYIKFLFNSNVDILIDALSVIPNITKENLMWKYLLFGALPFNAMLSFIICLITYFLYKRISIIFKRDFFKELPNQSSLPKVMVMIDSFKGTLSSLEANKITCDVLSKKGYITRSIPISDGGEGFIDTMQAITHLSFKEAITYDALCKKCTARYLYDEKNQIAYVELAECCGIKSLKKEELDPFHASSYGLGFLMNYIIEHHAVQKFIVGIGGSASSDGGAGMLEALGAEFYDESGELMHFMNNEKLMKITKLRLGSVKTKFEKIKVELLTDVNNPLLGENGAVYVFASQKGASPTDLPILESNLSFYKKQMESLGFIKTDVSSFGEGAAGGVGYAFNRVIRATTLSGVKQILEMLNFKAICEEFDVIITGEGCFDEQTLNGKVVKGIMEYHPKKLIVVAGYKKIDTNECTLYTVVPNICTIEESLAHPAENFTKLIESIEI